MAHWKDAVVTNGGVEMLNEWMAGRKITITSAYGGTGTVDPGLLTEQTGLVDMRQKLHLLGEENGADGKTVQVQVQNTGVTMEYELNQVGVYAVLDADRDPNAEERLLFIMQDEKGVAIPAAMDASFLLELYCMIGITNNGRFEVNVSAAGIVTIAYMQEKLERIMAEHNADKGAHRSLAVRMGMIETELNGSITIIQEADPSTETEGVKGQHYINAAAGTEFVCTGVTEAGYVWEPQESVAATTKNLLARIRGMELALNGSETIGGDGDPTDETKGVIGQHYINSATGEEFICTGVTEEGCIWEPLEAVKGVAQGLPLKAVTEEEYNALSEAEKAADVAYLVTDDAQDSPELPPPWNSQNQLDNWYFADPVNQQGQEEYEGEGYCIDRWSLIGALSVGSGGVSLAPSGNGQAALLQFFENTRLMTGETYTVSALFANGTLLAASGRVDRDAPQDTRFCGAERDGTGLYLVSQAGKGALFSFNIVRTGGKAIQPVAAKLELGPVQTLAHQDADGNWVLNDPPPNKALELAKCQRYFYNTMAGTSGSYVRIGYGVAEVSTNRCNVLMPTPVTMRMNPTATFESLALLDDNGMYHPVTDIHWCCLSPGGIQISVTSSELIAHRIYQLCTINDAVGKLVLDANL